METSNNYIYVKWNYNDVKSIRLAEKKKAKFENKGYKLVHEFANNITCDCTLTYTKK